MNNRFAKKTAISLAFILAIGSTLISKKANAHTSDDESYAVPDHACVWVVISPTFAIVDCKNDGTMCSKASECVR
jgi:hypothetical protein